MKIRSSLFALATVLLACGLNVNAADQSQPPNTLTEVEKQAGWRLLFDGKTTAGWRGYKMEKMPPGWQAIDGALVRVSGGAGGKGAGGGDDIVTTEEFENFDLQLEWKVLTNGNSGVLYHVSEEPVTAWHFAPEVQILDNTSHQTRAKKELAGACYDLLRAVERPDQAAGRVESDAHSGEWRARRALDERRENRGIRVVERRLEPARRRQQTQGPSEIWHLQERPDLPARPHRPHRVPQHQAPTAITNDSAATTVTNSFSPFDRSGFYRARLVP